MNPNTQNSIALLIDADNSPAAKIDFIITELASHGVVNIRRAYGNWTKPGLSGWVKVLHENSIQPMQSFDLVKGKNATDMALLIDAMDILYTKNVTTFSLVSSDSDFTPLIQRLRADGKEVFGFGGKNTPEPFIAACTRFLFLEEEQKIKGQEPTSQEPTQKLKGNTKLMSTLRTAIKAAAEEDGWAQLSTVRNHISNSGPFDHRTYGYKKFIDLVAAIDLFEIRKQISGNQTTVSVRAKDWSGKKQVEPATKAAAKKAGPAA